MARKRFQTFYNESSQVIELYDSWGMLREVDASGSIDECYELVLKALKLN